MNGETRLRDPMTGFILIVYWENSVHKETQTLHGNNAVLNPL